VDKIDIKFSLFRNIYIYIYIYIYTGQYEIMNAAIRKFEGTVEEIKDPETDCRMIVNNMSLLINFYPHNL